jgi:hypothetical protein
MKWKDISPSEFFVTLIGREGQQLSHVTLQLGPRKLFD